ncbi:MAG: PEP-CTERM sorting domain-containing protein [Puniceicoccaceae bacterium]|nr:MAG: PEP-CTERM sorting domain-containing protein [Puniceicoccaceae bacterium]
MAQTINTNFILLFSITHRRILQLIGLAGIIFLPAQANAVEPRFRPNQASMGDAEQTAFVNALHSMKQTPAGSGISVYDTFVKIHADAMDDHTGHHGHGGGANPAQAHMVPTFLPWHRQFIWEFETTLLAHDNTGLLTGLPYWNWALDQGPGSGPWGVNFLGGNGNPDNSNIVETGPFSPNSNWFLYDDPNEPLVRDFSQHFGLGTTTDIWRAMQVGQYDAAPWDPSASIHESFRNHLEGWGEDGPLLHNLGHVWVGGTMSDVSEAPFDPVFWMHHAFVDLIWSEWQLLYGLDNYLPEDMALMGFGADDLLWEFGVLIGDTFDFSQYDGIGYEYESTTIVPEPSAYALMFGSIALLWAVRRRRSRGNVLFRGPC